MIEVVGALQFGGSVPLEAEPGIVERHAFAVVNHLYEGPSGVLHNKLDGGRTGVHGVFQQFLHHGGGPLHHLAGRNLVGHRIGQ